MQGLVVHRPSAPLDFLLAQLQEPEGMCRGLAFLRFYSRVVSAVPRVLVLGPPAAGKTTLVCVLLANPYFLHAFILFTAQCTKLAAKSGCVLVHVPQIIDEAIAGKTEQGDKVHAFGPLQE